MIGIRNTLEYMDIQAGPVKFRCPSNDSMESSEEAMQNIDADETCAGYLKALGDPIRLRIVKSLQIGPLTVSDLAELLEIDIQKVSHHLRILYNADLLTVSKDGKFRYYQLNASFVKSRQQNKALDLGCCTFGLKLS